jgi:hypothetical protein
VTVGDNRTEETEMPTAVDTVPRPITPGAEMAALLRFHRDVTWTGTVAEGGMGPGTPAMIARGSGAHRVIQDGRWVVGDYRQDQYFAIPLAYGRDVDWHRNLTAAGHGVLADHGTRYTIPAPRVAPAAELTAALMPYWRRMLRGAPPSTWW